MEEHKGLVAATTSTPQMLKVSAKNDKDKDGTAAPLPEESLLHKVPLASPVKRETDQSSLTQSSRKGLFNISKHLYTYFQW